MVFKERAKMLEGIWMWQRRTRCIRVGAYGVGVRWLFVCDDHLSPSNSLGDLWMM